MGKTFITEAEVKMKSLIYMSVLLPFSALGI